MRKLDFRSTSEKVARSMSRQYGIAVEVGGDTAKTDGDTVYLPDFPDDAPKSTIRAMRGLADHEVGHLLYTKNDAKMHLSGVANGLANAFEDARIERLLAEEYPGTVLNMEAVEDWIDEQWEPGSVPPEKQLTAGAYLAAKGKDESRYVEDETMAKAIDDIRDLALAAADAKDTTEAVDLAEQAYSRIEHLFEDDEPDDQPPQSGDGDQSGDGEQEQEQDGGDDGGDEGSAEDGAAQDEGDEDSDGDTEQDAEGDEDSDGDSGDAEAGDQQEPDNEGDVERDDDDSKPDEDAEGDAEGEADGEAEADAEGDSDAEPDSGMETAPEDGTADGGEQSEGSRDSEAGDADAQGDASNTDSNPDGAEGTEDDESDDEPDADDRGGEYDPDAAGGDIISEAGSQMLDEVQEDEPGRHSEREYHQVWSTKYDQIEELEPADVPASHVLQKTRDVCRQARRALVTAVKSRERVWHERDKRRGDLDPRSLHRLANRTSNRVFRQEHKKTGGNAAVSLLVDESGSMEGCRIEQARTLASVLCQTLSKLGCPTEVLGFSNATVAEMAERGRRPYCPDITQQEVSDWRDDIDAQFQTSTMRFTRVSPLVVDIAKSFSDPWRQALPRIEALTHIGGTPMSEPIQIAAERLAERPEERRIMIVLTDGQANSFDSAVENRAVKRVVGRIEDGPMEIVGVGILCDSVEHIFSRHITTDEENLTADVLRELADKLKEGERG